MNEIEMALGTLQDLLDNRIDFALEVAIEALQDRIRGMSDEGLADWMALLKGDTSGGLARFMLKWLKQPVKEERHEDD